MCTILCYKWAASLQLFQIPHCCEEDIWDHSRKWRNRSSFVRCLSFCLWRKGQAVKLGPPWDWGPHRGTGHPPLWYRSISRWWNYWGIGPGYLSETLSWRINLRKLPIRCDVEFPNNARPPRATMATWRFQTGGIGSLCHPIPLHGMTYEEDLDVILEGIRIRLLDPYGPAARLEVRGMADHPIRKRNKFSISATAILTWRNWKHSSKLCVQRIKIS